MPKFVKLPRIGDDGALYVSVEDVVLVSQNADEDGPIEGTCVVYFREGSLALAVNLSPDAAMQKLGLLAPKRKKAGGS